MANLTPGATALNYIPPSFDQGLGRSKKGLDWNRENYVLGCMGVETLFGPLNVAQSQGNTTIQQFVLLPGRVKIPKIVVWCSALTSQALGAASFNIVLGTGAYVQGSVPGNDNSNVPPVGYNQIGEVTASSPTYPAGGGGICTNPAVAGNAMFAADVVLNTTNFPLITTATGIGPTYGVQLVPSSPDAVWPNQGVLTLRFTTIASATITNFIVAAYVEPQALQATWPGVGDGLSGQPPEPTLSF